MQKCPGQDKRTVEAENRICSQCGYKLEFFSDEMVRYCPSCHSRQLKDSDPLCAAWCSAALACLGDAEKVRRIKDKVRSELNEEDQQRIRDLIRRVKVKCQK